MVLSVVRARARAGAQPSRPLVLAFTADEEAGSTYGAEHLVESHADLLVGLHGRDRRGRGLQRSGERASPLPDPGCREGDGLDAAEGAWHGRARLDGQPRQRREPAGGGRGEDRCLRVADHPHARDGDAAGHGRRAGRDRADPRERRGAGPGVRPRRPADRGDPAAHHQPHRTDRGLQGERDPRARPRLSSTGASCPATRTTSSRPWRPSPERASRSTTSPSSPPSARRTRGASSTRCTGRSWPRTTTP